MATPYIINPNHNTAFLQAQADYWKRMALTDELTELPNRLALKLHMQEETGYTDHHRSAKKDITIMFIDLDDFGPINKIHGNENGDRALRAVAQAINAAIREDDRIFRKGGDEFVALLYGADINDANSTVARRIEKLLADGIPVELDNGQTILVKGSIGLFEYDPALTLTDNVAQADAEMIVAKKQRKLEKARHLAESGQAAPAAPGPAPQLT